MSRVRSTRWLESADVIGGAIFGVLVALGGLLRLLGAAAWISIAFAVVAVLGGVFGLTIKLAHRRALRRDADSSLLRVEPVRAGQAARRSLFYDLGVDAEARDALSLLDAEHQHAPYVERDVMRELRTQLTADHRQSGVRLIVLSGRAKAGKSRALLETIAATFPESWILAPARRESLSELIRSGPPPKTGRQPIVLWLDDIELWAAPVDGLNAEALAGLQSWRRNVIVAATQGGKGIDLSGPTGVQYREITSDLTARAWWHGRLDARPNRNEIELAAQLWGTTAADRAAEQGFGEVMVDAQRLAERFHDGEAQCAEGRAIVDAAIDCRRAGLLRPLTTEELERLYGHYLPPPAAPRHAAFDAGLKWATLPLYATTALLNHQSEDHQSEEATNGLVPYDFLVDYVGRTARGVNADVWDLVADELASDEFDLLAVADVSLRVGSRRDIERAERALRRADLMGSARAAYNLSVVLRAHGEVDEADAALLRADGRGDAEAPNLIGARLTLRGDLSAAEVAYRRAYERGSSDAAVNLGGILHERGEIDEAEVAYRRADAAGNPAGSNGLGTVLMDRGDEDGALAAFVRADERGSPLGALNLGALLLNNGDKVGAEAAYRRADERGEAAGTFEYGRLLQGRGDLQTAEEKFRRAEELGYPAGANALGLLLEKRGEHEQAERAYLRADQAGDPEAPGNLGRLLFQRGDMGAALIALQRADERGSAEGAQNLGQYYLARDNLNLAESAFARGAERGSATAAYNQGQLRRQRGDVDGAIDSWRRADELGHAEAPFNLGRALKKRGDLANALKVWGRGDERGDGSSTHELGIHSYNRGDFDQAEEYFRRAADRRVSEAAYNLGLLLKQQRRDLTGAAAAWRASEALGNSDATAELGRLLEERGDGAAAERAYRDALQRNSALAGFYLGNFLQTRGNLERGDIEGAVAAFRRADRLGHALAATNLGGLLERLGDRKGAEAAFRRGDERGDATAAFRLGRLLSDRGDDDAHSAFKRARDRGYKD